MEVKAFVIVDFFIACITVILIAFDRTGGSMATRRNRSYDVLLSLLLVSVFFDFLSRLDAGFLSRIGNFGVFALDPFSLFAILAYVDTWMDERPRAYRVVQAVLGVLACLNLVILVWSRVAEVNVFYTYQGDSYARGPYYGVRAAFLTATFLTVFGYALVNRKRIMATFRGMVVAYTIFPMLLGFFQVYFTGVSFTYMGMSLASLMLFAFVQNRAVNEDALTGVASRRRFDAQLRSLCEQAEGGGMRAHAFSVIMVDVNDFKKINDSWGHQEGDDALRSVARVLETSVRQADCVARYGGDEFCLLVVSPTDDVAPSVVGRVHEGLARSNEAANRGYDLSLAAGWSVCHPGDAQTAQDLINAADQMMYADKRAKAVGR